MDELKMRFYRPVVTGTPHLDAFGAASVNRTQQDSQQASFEDVLKAQLESAGGVSFSKHAIKRAAENRNFQRQLRALKPRRSAGR